MGNLRPWFDIGVIGVICGPGFDIGVICVICGPGLTSASSAALVV
ncbi:MAG: hypothetical protein WC815_16180 [Vicinamibacterales bacterium]|jgi:hypothetical protein